MGWKAWRDELAEHREAKREKKRQKRERVDALAELKKGSPVIKEHEHRDESKKESEKMILNRKKDERKICANVKCKNTAGKDSAFCGIHKPKMKANNKFAVNSKVGCHKGNVLVFTTPEGIEVYGGGSSRSGGWWVMDPRPDLAIGPKEIVNKAVSSHKFPKGWLIDSIIEPTVPIVALDFPDYGVPKNLGKVFWMSLVEDIYTKGVKRISCQCMGGHGRTGVQLAILAHYLLPESQHKWKDAGELIDWVRKHMCKHEVESKSQQDYIADVCDIPVGDAKVATSRYSYTSSHATGIHSSSNWNWDGTKWSDLIDEDDDDDFTDGDETDTDKGTSIAAKRTGMGQIDLSYDKLDSSPIEEGDLVYECVDCEVREVWDGSQDPMELLVCLECRGEMIDITDLPEVQAEIRELIHAEEYFAGTGYELPLIKEQGKIQEDE